METIHSSFHPRLKFHSTPINRDSLKGTRILRAFGPQNFPPLSPNESSMLLIKQIGEHNRNYTKQQCVTYPPSCRRPGSRRPPPPTRPPPTTTSTTSSAAPPPTPTSRRCQVDRPNSQPQMAPRRLGLLFPSLTDASEGFSSLFFVPLFSYHCFFSSRF
jgi:hypothetical protein